MDLGPLHIDRLSAGPIDFQGLRLTPQHLLVRLDIPGGHGGLIFNRAIAVQVEQEGQPPKTLPVLNYTRIYQVLILGLGMLAGALFFNRRNS